MGIQVTYKFSIMELKAMPSQVQFESLELFSEFKKKKNDSPSWAGLVVVHIIPYTAIYYRRKKKKKKKNEG
jgi:hypothetical protein